MSDAVSHFIAGGRRPEESDHALGWTIVSRPGRGYIRWVRALVRSHWKFFLANIVAGLGLRLLFFWTAPRVTDDSHIYADIAKNWLQYGTYGVSAQGRIVATYMRLPGYPAFLAGIFAIFGVENFRAVLLWQIAIDLTTCLLIADIARRLFSEQAAKAAFTLAVFCPFLANYSAAVLSETLEISFTALALDLALIGLADLSHGRMRAWIGTGLAITGCIYIRPDGGLLLVAIELYLLYLFVKFVREHLESSRVIRAGALLAVFSLAPLAPWTLRNLRVMHEFEPLTPRYANEPDEFVPMGFNHWVKTWMAEYTSVEEVYWQEPGTKIDPGVLPNRAFDSPEQKQRTLQALEQYNETTDIDPELDSKFESLARERRQNNPLRYYVRLPALRIADMWLRPRTELLPSDPRWWEFNDDRKWLALSLGFGVINLAYVVMAIFGWWRTRTVPYVAMLITYVLVRSIFLGTLENPEPRYTLECYPVLIVFFSAILLHLPSSRFQNP
jgi:4-amino-4-deoxy-L-arabinose transferase-like glycosyltransferase